MSRTLTVGAAYRKAVKIRLDELCLLYAEHRTLVDSVIVVKVYTQQQKPAYEVFMGEYIAFVKRLAALDRQEERKELERKNRFRRLTFRKPLVRLNR